MRAAFQHAYVQPQHHYRSDQSEAAYQTAPQQRIRDQIDSLSGSPDNLGVDGGGVLVLPCGDGAPRPGSMKAPQVRNMPVSGGVRWLSRAMGNGIGEIGTQ